MAPFVLLLMREGEDALSDMAIHHSAPLVFSGSFEAHRVWGLPAVASLSSPHRMLMHYRHIMDVMIIELDGEVRRGSVKPGSDRLPFKNVIKY